MRNSSYSSATVTAAAVAATHSKKNRGRHSFPAHCVFMTRLLMLLLCGGSAIGTHAQKKEIGRARDILKSRRNPAEAERIINGLLKDSANRQDKRIYALWFESVHQQYLSVNEKLYMKQRQDTAQFFGLTRRLFNVAFALDSIDAAPDKKGRIDTEYRKDNAQQLNAYRPNLFFGGIYHIRKGDYQQAFDFLETYLDCAGQPLFGTYQLDSTDKRRAEAAHWATFCGYKLHNPLYTLRYRHLALSDTARAMATLQYVAEARQWLNDDSLYMETLRMGFTRNPQNEYFFPHLMDYYNAHNQYEEALHLADQALATNQEQPLFLLAKATTLLSLKRYDECLAVSKSLIALCDTMPEAYYHAGAATLNKALVTNARRNKKQTQELYSQARQYMERYQQLAPEQKQKWGPALYRIYLNLNMGKQFDEIDRLLRK